MFQKITNLIIISLNQEYKRKLFINNYQKRKKVQNKYSFQVSRIRNKKSICKEEIWKEVLEKNFVNNFNFDENEN